MTQRPVLAYTLLLLVQTICALVILFHIHSTFRILVERIGQQQTLPAAILAQVVAAALLGQCCYWLRLYRLPIPKGFRSLVLGHALAFAARLGAIVGGALASIYFLRHLPELTKLADGFTLVWRSGALLAIVFALYCYTLELERLAAAWQAEPEAQPSSGAPAREPEAPAPQALPHRPH
ncbi:hypothetical protein [Bosea sp. (in: a-proteobacteria)]|uniref:Uncharacterized protein n=1 Tax=Bosea vestrisii TaxID=151416 RepID=A0ABW0HIX5_9HYPH|nr:hypothetical protein [Bosea sp. (in: a-proteobacteria)]MBR3191894.1 hypothetical protein [Bosea sp. (in: a-proteobacteria)]